MKSVPWTIKQQIMQLKQYQYSLTYSNIKPYTNWTKKKLFEYQVITNMPLHVNMHIEHVSEGFSAICSIVFNI